MFHWKVPQGGDDQFVKLAKGFFWAAAIAAVVFGLFKLWNWLEDVFGEEDKADIATGVLDQTASSVWAFIADWAPALLALAILFVILGVFSGLFVRLQYRKREADRAKYIRILPSGQVNLELEKIAELTRTFGGMVRPWQLRFRFGRPWFRLRFAIPSGSNEIGIYMAYPRDKENSVKDTIRSVYPSAEIHDITEEQFPQPSKGGAGGHFYYAFGSKKGLPLASLQQTKKSQLESILNCLRPGTYLDLQFAPVSWKELADRSEDALDQLKRKKMKDMDPEDRMRRISLMQRLTGRELTFHVRLTLWSNHEKANQVIRSTAESIETAMKHDGAITFYRHNWWNMLDDKNLVPIPWPFTIMTWDCDEIANLFHLPPSDGYIYQEPKEEGPDVRGYIAHLEPNQRSLTSDELTEGVLIGKIRHPLESREVRVPYEQLSKHFLITGASGMGKSSLTVEMLQSMLNDWFDDPDNHPGFTVFDPAREIIPIIENRLRVAEQFGVKFPREKVHHFNLSHDATHVPALNLLHRIEGLSSNQLAHEVATVLVTLAEENESLLRTRRLMGMAVQSLLEDNERHTILGIDDLFRNEAFRKRVLQNVNDPYVKRFWANADEQELRREAEFVIHRVDRLLQSPTMRRLFCQKEMSLDVRRYMDEGHIVLIDAYGLKEYDLRVTAGHILNQYYQTARRRPAGSRFHLMMMDEAHLMQIPLLTEIFMEDRKYDFGLGLITREIDQFNNEELMQTMKSNIGMVISCAQTEGSDEVESLTRNSFRREFIESLPVRHAAVYIRLKRRQRSAVTTCVVENEPPHVYKPDGKEANHRTPEKEEAMQWGLEWGLEIMKNSPEVRPVEVVDREVADYMNASLDYKQNSG
ncbi:helicase HerA domain-containing protein [Staphylospora marina]|uniref:helicase HerA domain-containing protein n=1 Tax=Staphylospora marina TaxID=2490858 RepID=UPI000F5BE0D2|nr:DUF87 domain-containing protein [Staphylospora marina]